MENQTDRQGYRLSPGIWYEELDGRTVIVHLQQGRFYELNHSGSVMLPALLASGRLEDAVDALREHYQVDLEKATRDVRRTVQQLLEAGLIEFGQITPQRG